MTIQDIALEKARLEFGRACIYHNVMHTTVGNISVMEMRTILKRAVTAYEQAVHDAVHRPDIVPDR